MKICPICRREYNDDTFSFCLEDGTLLSASDSQATVYDGQATLHLPKPADNSAATLYIPPTQKFQPNEPSPSEIIQKLLNHLKDESQKFSLIGKFSFNNEFIWTNSHFFEIAESIPSALTALFPLKESSIPVDLVKSLQTQLTTTYTIVPNIVPSEKEGMTDLISHKATVHINNIYFQYLQMRYPKAVIMTGASAYNPALFVSDDKLQAGIMGVKM